jgi:limonene-1,2-epoxide hydrolase
MTEKETIVREFLAAWGEGDARKLADYFTEDAVFRMMPRDPVRDREPIHEDFKAQLAWTTDCDFEITSVATVGNTVFTERIDRMKIAGAPVELPVVGVFEVNDDGKFAAWRDYFDMNAVMTQLSAAGIGADADVKAPIPPPPGS